MSQRQRASLEKQLAKNRAERIVGGTLAVAILGGAAVQFTTRGGDGEDAPVADTAQVSMTEFGFDPDPIVLPSGDGAQLEVVNDGAVAHDLVVGELGKGTPDLDPGVSMVLDLSAQPAGTYRVVCDLPGHTEAGMVTELVLE